MKRTCELGASKSSHSTPVKVSTSYHETNPSEFLSTYESVIEAAHGDENTKGKVIHLALDGIARSWYFNLPPSSIYS